MSGPVQAAAAASPLPAEVLEQAADWLMRLHAGGATEADRQACERWRLASPVHARAWTRAERLMQQLGGLPPALALPALDRPRGPGRRAAVRSLAALLALPLAGGLGWRLAERAGWTADHRTATGERRHLRLADGSTLTLNTATAVDVRFDGTQRLLVLRHGEILIETGKHPEMAGLPLRVRTAQGLVQALGTRFSVRQHDGETEVAVFAHAVRLAPARAPASAQQVLAAGQTARFTEAGVQRPAALPEGADAWRRGMLLADRMRLADLAVALARHRGGIVRCDPAVAELRVSGTFPLDDTDRALTMLVSTYPVAALKRLRGRWVTLVPA